MFSVIRRSKEVLLVVVLATSQSGYSASLEGSFTIDGLDSGVSAESELWIKGVTSGGNNIDVRYGPNASSTYNINSGRVYYGAWYPVSPLPAGDYRLFTLGTHFVADQLPSYNKTYSNPLSELMGSVTSDGVLNYDFYRNYGKVTTQVDLEGLWDFGDYVGDPTFSVRSFHNNLDGQTRGIAQGDENGLHTYYLTNGQRGFLGGISFGSGVPFQTDRWWNYSRVFNSTNSPIASLVPEATVDLVVDTSEVEIIIDPRMLAEIDENSQVGISNFEIYNFTPIASRSYRTLKYNYSYRSSDGNFPAVFSVLLRGEPGVYPSDETRLLVTYYVDGVRTSKRVPIEFAMGAPEATDLGSNVELVFDSGSENNDVTLTFNEVSGEGSTSFNTTTSGPSSPEGFKLANNQGDIEYYDIRSSADFDSAQLCLNYEDTQLNENTLKLFHFECDGLTGQCGWQDITDANYPDKVNNVICGTTTSFSIFALLEKSVTDSDSDGINDNEDNCPSVPNLGQENFDGDAFGDVCDTDSDADGIEEGIDQCLATPLGSVIDNNGCNSEQRLLLNCPVADFRNHGQYIKCLTEDLNEQVSIGLIDEFIKGEIISQAAQFKQF